MEERKRNTRVRDDEETRDAPSKRMESQMEGAGAS